MVLLPASLSRAFSTTEKIDFFIADFYCHTAELVIEIDGSQHYEPKGQQHDDKRTEVLQKYGLEVLRFSNRDINIDFRSVCEKIDNTVRERMTGEREER